MLKLTGRYYQSIPIDQAHAQTEDIEFDPARTALVVLHCWDIGCEGGPEIDRNYLVGMGFYENFREAERMMRQCIRPSMDAARNAGILVCHVEGADIWRKHPACQEELDPPSPPAPASTPLPGPAVPGWRDHILARAHGKDYATQSPYARMDRAKVVAAQPGEPFVYQTGQLHRVLRRYGIENLIYAGFATDMCILRAQGGAEPMATLGYRLFLMRDATLGVEYPDSFEERLATRWGIRYFETHCGDTVISSDFIRACEALL